MATYRMGEATGDIQDFETLDEALNECWDRAREQAKDEGIDEDDLDEYGTDDPNADRWGVCPSNNDGAYWPSFRRIA